LAARAITKLLPEFKSSNEPSVRRRATLMEGVARRLELVGKPLEMEGTLLDGSEFDWDAYRGKVVLVDFFANWCEVCRAEVPNILQHHRAYRDKGFEIVGVSLDDQPALAEAYRKQTGFQFPTLFSRASDAADWDNPLAIKYGITTLPRAILVDQNGVVVDTIARGQRLSQRLRELLGAPGASINSSGRVGDLDQEPTGELGAESSIVPTAFEEEGDAQESTEESPAPIVPED
jgi:thiol-disulfide isomerase/thioredoxin